MSPRTPCQRDPKSRESHRFALIRLDTLAGFPLVSGKAVRHDAARLRRETPPSRLDLGVGPQAGPANPGTRKEPGLCLLCRFALPCWPAPLPSRLVESF